MGFVSGLAEDDVVQRGWSVLASGYLWGDLLCSHWAHDVQESELESLSQVVVGELEVD